MVKWARTASGDMVMPLVGSGVAAIETDPTINAARKLQDRFQLWLGEWFANVNLGFPWPAYLRTKSPNLGLLASAANAYAIATPGISTADISPTIDAARRHLSMPGTATLTTGGTFPVTVSP